MGSAMGTAGCGGGGPKAGPGGTNGTWMLRRALVQIPGERTALSAARNAEIFALENMFAQRAPLLLQEFRGKQRAGLYRPSLSAGSTSDRRSPKPSRTDRCGSTPSTAWQTAPAGGAPASAAARRSAHQAAGRLRRRRSRRPPSGRGSNHRCSGSASTRDPLSSSSP